MSLDPFFDRFYDSFEPEDTVYQIRPLMQGIDYKALPDPNDLENQAKFNSREPLYCILINK
ncbi:hypothetical protein DICPUDRAFT_158518 [Dictyostelium purpureum]|uniref:Uncharacterized protein n=1 Tax=Dictyostelium purpureum TaxID=5786 RepID=F1A1T2_DICPU|nr:uncharacterized protein DICPUDRAFT_158518 [Dictyostelium purpureum]EGC29848.1 hypothetical protein DICPUDRAFT_158518 [Dictyostelium purpureum]|eukprot:XP_003293622.1 hypothetical protein DICPUDRAFT_158518 [Dictyostelium purpureum]